MHPELWPQPQQDYRDASGRIYAMQPGYATPLVAAGALAIRKERVRMA
jgi:hypothetical protein